MCGRYVLVSSLKRIEKRFNLLPSKLNLFQPQVNLSIGQYAPVISGSSPDQLQLMQFGMTPFWAKKPMYLFNARSEGDRNKDNNPQYTGSMGIINKPAFRASIRRRRCLVIVDAFIEGSKQDRLNKPYLIYMRSGQRPFALAGIWDRWVHKATGEVLDSFAIVTTTANELLQNIGHHRSPVVLSVDQERAWIDPNSDLSQVVEMLHPYPSEQLNAYPISPKIKNPRAEGMDLLQPVGQRIYPLSDYELYQELRMQGMGETTARKRRSSSDPPTLFD